MHIHISLQTRIVLAAALGFACLRVQAQAVLTVDDAISLALIHNRAIAKTALEPEKADDQIAAAWTQRLPQFKLTALAGQILNNPSMTYSKGILGNLPAAGPVPANSIRVDAPSRPVALAFPQLNLPLSEQYRIGLGLKRLAIQKDMKKEDTREARAKIVASVRETYYRLLVTQSGSDTAERNLNLLKETERVTLRYVSEKTVLHADFLGVQARRAQAEYEATSLRDELSTQREQLNSLLGRPIDVDFAVQALDEVDSATPDLASLRERALASSPAIRRAYLKVREAEVGTTIKKSEYIPDIDLNVSYIALGGATGLLPRGIAFAGVVINWEPFDWGRKRRESAQLVKLESQAELTLQEEQDRVRVAVGMQVRKLTEARQLLAVARLNQEKCREDARVMQVRYSQNAVLLKNVLESESAMSAADQQTQKAVEAWWVAQSDLEEILGGK